MALNPSVVPSLTKFKVLSFDIYGTIIDWSSGTSEALQPLTSRLDPNHPAATSKEARLNDFHRVEVPLLKANPTILYDNLLAQTYSQLAKLWDVTTSAGEPEAFAVSISTYAPFPDSVAAMQRLHGHYRLVALSNISKSLFAGTLSGPLAGVHFDAIYTAEDIGSYKPDQKNFEYLLKGIDETFGIQKEELLHVAQGLKADHEPSKQMRLWSAWISRGRSKDETKYDGVGDSEGKVGYQWRWWTLEEMADEVEAQFEEVGWIE